MAGIICLANSIKKNERCIAGIDLSTGQWVRPIGRGHEGAIGNVRLINGCEPQLLDVLEIPLGGLADNLGCQPENRILQNGAWTKTSSMTVTDIDKYTENTSYLLHNRDRSVRLSTFASKPKNKWKSLQLIQVQNARFFRDDYEGKKRRRCSFRYRNTYYDFPVTCPSFDNHINSRLSCYLTISMSGPIAFAGNPIKSCWKIVAGIIPLPDNFFI